MSRGDKGLILLLLGLLLLSLVFGIGFLVMGGADNADAPESEGRHVTLKAPGGQAEVEPDRAQPDSKAGKAEVQAPAKSKARFPMPAKALDAKMRRERLAAILAKLSPPAEEGSGEGDQASSDASSSDTSGLKGSLSKTGIKDAVREVIPLVQECYELALAEDAGVAGRLQVKFEIVGDEEYGGLVTSSEIVTPEGKTVPSQLLAECVKESMYALDLPVPEGGGKVIVNYPFIFKTAPSTAPAP